MRFDKLCGGAEALKEPLLRMGLNGFFDPFSPILRRGRLQRLIFFSVNGGRSISRFARLFLLWRED